MVLSLVARSLMWFPMVWIVGIVSYSTSVCFCHLFYEQISKVNTNSSHVHKKQMYISMSECSNEMQLAYKLDIQNDMEI